MYKYYCKKKSLYKCCCTMYTFQYGWDESWPWGYFQQLFILINILIHQNKNNIFSSFLSWSRSRKNIFSTATNRIIIRKVTSDVINDNQNIAFLIQMYKMISCKVRRNFELFENWEEISNFLKTKKKFQTFWKLRRNFKLISGFLFAIQRLLLWICQSVFFQSVFFNKKKVSNCIFLECTRQLTHPQNFASLFYPGITSTSLCICNLKSSKLCEFIFPGITSTSLCICNLKAGFAVHVYK